MFGLPVAALLGKVTTTDMLSIVVTCPVDLRVSVPIKPQTKIDTIILKNRQKAFVPSKV